MWALPQDAKDWQLIAKNFQLLWDFPHCLGALDGKHVLMKAPDNSGSLFYNYKHNFSIVLMALVDAKYKLILIDVGAYGRKSDGGVLQASNFGKALYGGRLPFPAPEPLQEAPQLGPMPYWQMKLSHWRSTSCVPTQGVASAFLMTRPYSTTASHVQDALWKIPSEFWQPGGEYMNVASISMWRTSSRLFWQLVCCITFWSTPLSIPVLAPDQDPATQIRGLQPLEHFGFRAGQEAMEVRDRYKVYFTDHYQLPYQQQYVQRGNEWKDLEIYQDPMITSGLFL